MDIDKTIAKLELKHMLEELLDAFDYPRSAVLADYQNWTKKHLSSFLSYAKVLLPPCSRICFWLPLPSVVGDKARANFYELKDGYAEIKTLHAESFDENEAEDIQSIREYEFFYVLRRAIIYGLFFFPPWYFAAVENCTARTYDQQPDVSFILQRSRNLEFTGLILQLLGVNK